MGLNKFLSGIISYQSKLRPQLLNRLASMQNKGEKPSAVMFSCMDSRILTSRLMECDAGDMFIVRNAGNLVPHQENVKYESMTTEPGALELGCVINDIRHVIVCGHSDCKAMNLLHSIKDSVREPEGTPLQLWLKRHGQKTVQKYEQLEKLGGVGPLTYFTKDSKPLFRAHIDPENKFGPADKFSQVNTLQQVENIASQDILQEKLKRDEVRINALWFDIHTADFYMFSRNKERFILLNEENQTQLVQDGEAKPSAA